MLAAAKHTPDRNTGLLEGAADGSWSLGIVEQRATAAIDCVEKD